MENWDEFLKKFMGELKQGMSNKELKDSASELLKEFPSELLAGKKLGECKPCPGCSTSPVDEEIEREVDSMMTAEPETKKVDKKSSTVFQKDINGRFVVDLKVMLNTEEKRAKDICPVCGNQHKKFRLKKKIQLNVSCVKEWEFECPTCQSPLYVLNDAPVI